MKPKALMLLLVMVVPLMAQEAKKDAAPAKTETVSKVFEVRNQDPQILAALIGGLGAQLRPSVELKAIAVSGPPAVVDAVGEAIKRFDLPVKNVELTAYLLSASQQAAKQETVPKELDGVVKQLKGLFTYQGYRLLDTMIGRGREGRSLQMSSAGPAQISQPDAKPIIYQLNIGSFNVTPQEKATVVRMNQLRFSANVTGFNTGINTDLDVREGQKVVVGNTGMGVSGDALILVVTAKVTE
jgi:hypothetical protein